MKVALQGRTIGAVNTMKRVLLLVFSVIILAVVPALAIGSMNQQGEADRPSLPSIPDDRPMTVLVKGWLWDASTRGSSWAPIREFQPRLNEILETENGYSTKLMEYPWSRLPRDVVRESNRFTEWASDLSRVSEEGSCINYVGHSAGAAFVYRAASQGVPMGFMGTLGLPTFGRGRPPKVQQWTNFFTSAHPDDIAGRLWGETIAADVNVDIGQEHRRFWSSPEVARTSAEGISQAWQSCRSGTNGR